MADCSYYIIALILYHGGIKLVSKIQQNGLALNQSSPLLISIQQSRLQEQDVVKVNKEKKIAVLYICTGRYIAFWDGFSQSCDEFFMKNENVNVEYVVFTDASNVKYSGLRTLHIYHQEQLEWPHITLDRFSIFLKAKSLLETMDYVFFFNANMQFVKHCGDEFLVQEEKPLLVVKHPGYFDKGNDQFTYERNYQSKAYIPVGEGNDYFMGGLNGGTTKAYLRLISELKNRTEEDKKNQIIAVWHDESHLNRYAYENSELLTVLDPSYGFVQNWDLPFEGKIIIRDKKKFGGHKNLRAYSLSSKPSIFKKIFGNKGD